jgi:mRNA interferase MazF
VSRLPLRGDVIVVDLGGLIGHEAGPTRPAVVVSHDQLAHVGLVSVLPVTRTRVGWPSHVEVEPDDSNLRETSYVQTEQIRTISTERVTQVVSRLPSTSRHTVDGLLRTNLALG